MSNTVKKPLYQVINGIRCASMFYPKCFREALEYKPRSDDVFIVTYPKCGTTWMQNIVMYIFRKGEPLEKMSDFIIMSPFIDMLGNEGVSRMPRPGAIKTHFSYTDMPYSPDAKYIFVVRNPKDCCVSFYHHVRMLPGYAYDENFDHFFELFMSGEVDYDDYFDHLLSWYPHRNDKNNFYITYEDMKKDNKNTVMRLAKFLGDEYYKMVQADNNILNNILHYSGFPYMKANLGDIYGLPNLRRVLNDPDAPEGLKFYARFTNSVDIPESKTKMEFIRKGVVGDFKNHFTEQQEERLNKKFQEKTKGTEIGSWWIM